MKYFYLGVFLLLNIKSYSQTSSYVPFPLNGAYWIVRQHINVYPAAVNIVSEYYQTGADTTIGANSYKIIFNQFNNPVSALRQDIPNKKVYAIQFTTPPSSEFLLYDFNIAIGDTFKNRTLAGCDTNAILTSIDTIIIGSTPRRKYNYYVPLGVAYYYAYVVEGMGNLAGLYEYSCFEGHSSLCSFFQYNTNFSYVDSSLYYCPPSGLINLNEISLKLWPNPTNNILNVEFLNEASNTKAIIYNCQFGKIKEEKLIGNFQSTIDMTNFSQGIYFIQFVQTKKLSKIYKVIKD